MNIAAWLHRAGLSHPTQAAVGHGAHVRLDGVAREEQPLGNLGVAQPPAHQREHLGGVVGQVIGKDAKGTVIGAATGAAAGTAAAAATANYEGCVNDGGRIVVKLTSPLTIKAA